MNLTRKHLKIFFVANTSWYLINFRLPLLKAVLSQTNHVYALSPFDSYTRYFQDYGIKHIEIPITRSGINPFVDLNLILKFIHFYNMYKPDIVQQFTIKPVIYGTIAAHLCQIKCICNMVPGMGYVFTGASLKHIFIQKVVRFLYRNTMILSHHVFFQNKDDFDYFLRFKLVTAERASIVPGTGVNIEKFKPSGRKQRKNIVFLLAARMLWDKGIGEYVEAARILKRKYQDISFWLLGPVDLQNPKAIKREKLDEWSQAGLVHYLGMTDNIRSFYEKADVIVLPSYYKEGIPLSLLEGAAMGLPIVSTDSTGCRDVVENGKNGYLVPIKDIVQLAYAMEQFIIDPQKIKTMGEQSRKMAVAKFDSQAIVKQILKYYPI